ncbi:hypothetical protein FGM00_17405 [Aggregatimonas sangjinii]|uniref:Outer membrane protein beta-barrel domain-containing protein n=1 Tax=Aggregatimonas sangjinii TaxID=2583587 RepID=A0A5B7ST06_9FLAO|nr:outer membrane beta-barrel protein [Aggregatimonas sangjinii]QCX01806.1 hypothetical protein FGM00_17405 [Aggregatimonas sangjinii]
MGKKKLDELFQEKFDNFEQVPDEKVWQSLEASLDKKKRRAIPLWWKLGGVAAVLVIGLLAINPFSDADGEPALTDIEQKTDSLERENTKENRILDTTDTDETQLTDTNSQDTDEGNAADKQSHPSKNTNPDPKKELQLSPTSENGGESQLTSVQKERSNKSDPNINAQITESTDNESTEGIDPKENLKELNEIDQESVVAQKDPKKSVSDESVNGVIAQQEDRPNSVEEKKDGLMKSAENTEIAQNDSVQEEENLEDQTVEEGNKKSIFDEIKQQEETEIAENEPRKRWSAGPSVAPVYFDAFGEGSPVHSILVPNSKSGETNLSYGLSVNYEINDRLSVRSGLHKVAYGYDTGDVEFSSSLDGAITDQMDNIDYATTARNLVVRSKAGASAVSVSESDSNQAFDANSSNASIARNGTMSQQFGYLEVPLELNYALVDRKVGINVIGGFSSLFLIDNSVSLTSGNETTEMGEANNVNEVNFSTNIGLGIDYNVTPKIKLNLEPLFKYQLNTFSQVDGTFNPFSIGIYSGLTFKF